MSCWNLLSFTSNEKEMHMGYQQLTQEERYYIWALKKARKTKTQIAREMGRHPSTIGREYKRNSGSNGYQPRQAQQLADRRKTRANRRIRFTSEVEAVVTEKLNMQWSPEQISGRLRQNGKSFVSHERIYQFVQADRKAGGMLYKNLRHGKRKRRKRCCVERRGKIPNRTGIEQRPAIVDQRSRLGDWEGDTIIGSQRKGALISLAERKSQYLLLRPVVRKKASKVARAIIQAGKEFSDQFLTLTFDNGLEFAAHEKISEKRCADIYFAQPYHSWERGLNEQLNGLVRQYFPKGSSLRAVTLDEVLHVQNLINHRPRKKLGWLTPHEVLVGGLKVQLT
jgi:transposase, IS30 family